MAKVFAKESYAKLSDTGTTGINMAHPTLKTTAMVNTTTAASTGLEFQLVVMGEHRTKHI